MSFSFFLYSFLPLPAGPTLAAHTRHHPPAHSKLPAHFGRGCRGQPAPASQPITKSTRQQDGPTPQSGAEAEAVAFVVSQAIGLQTTTAASDSIQIYDGKAEPLAASLNRM